VLALCGGHPFPVTRLHRSVESARARYLVRARAALRDQHRLLRAPGLARPLEPVPPHVQPPRPHGQRQPSAEYARGRVHAAYGHQRSGSGTRRGCRRAHAPRWAGRDLERRQERLGPGRRRGRGGMGARRDPGRSIEGGRGRAVHILPCGVGRGIQTTRRPRRRIRRLAIGRAGTGRARNVNGASASRRPVLQCRDLVLAAQQLGQQPVERAQLRCQAVRAPRIDAHEP
jgi:hypothetical protein